MTAKTIKRLAMLIIILGLIGGAAFWAQRYQLTKMAASVAARAKLAEKTGNLSEAEWLYQQHLEVVPDDTDTAIQYADMIGKSDNVIKQQEAIGLYSNVLKRYGGLTDVRRKRMDLQYRLKNFPAARTDLAILLPMDKDDPELQFTKADGEVLFKMGRCCEAEGDDDKAARYYRAAINNHAMQQLEAYQRLAGLLRKKPGHEKEADQLIEKMVNSDRGNYQVYMERGRYRSLQAQSETEPHRSQLLANARQDFQKAAGLAPDVPEIVLELAQAVAADKSGRSAARQILENGLNAAPKSVELYQALANIELEAGQADKAIAVLERGLEAQPESLQLHLVLAEILAQRGSAGKLLLHIEELKKLGCSLRYVQYLTAYYHAILHQYQKAQQLLVPLLAETGQRSNLTVQVNLLLARCYRQLGETQMEQDAYGRALIANSGNVGAKLGYINAQIQQGDLEGAIEGYRELLGRVPEARTSLARLLIARNRQQPAAGRDWDEVESQVNEATKVGPESVSLVIVRADLILARDPTKVAEARAILREARKRFPKDKSVELWTTEARIISELGEAQTNPIDKQKKVDEALTLLDEAQEQVGDQVELRLQRARLWVTKMGPQVVPALIELAQNIQAFSKEDRRKLLYGLAGELVRQQNLKGADRLWSQLAEDDPDDIRLRSILADLAIQLGNKDEIEKNIAQIKRIEGDEGIQSRYWQVRYLIWQINQVGDPKTRRELRTKARASLTELRARRPDWSVIPRTLAELDEDELGQGNLDEQQKQAKLESIVNSYIEAINLGQRDSIIVRHVVELLFAQGRGSEALALFNRIPVALQLAGDLGHKVAQVAIDHRDFQRAAEIARKTMTANPGSFNDCLWLVRILHDGGFEAEAEKELKNAVGLSKDDPNRWIALVQWYAVLTKQPEKAEQAIQEAEKNLPRAKAPRTLAQCCELMAQAYEAVHHEAAKVKWYSVAEKWYEKDRVAQPDDLPATRRLTDFFIRTKQLEKVNSLLNAVLKNASGKNSDMTVWARRTLALTLASGTDPKRLKEALSLVEPRDQPTPTGAKAKEDPEDLRILTRVLELQGTPEHRARAVKLLQSLVTQNLATAEDRFRLARLMDTAGDWPGAREVYHELIARTDNVRDLETLNRRSIYLLQFASALFRHHRAGDNQDLAEVHDLIGKLKRLQPDTLEVLALEVESHRLQNQLDKVDELLQNFANRPNLTPGAHGKLAEMAEQVGRFELAEKLYRGLVNRWPDLPQGKMALIAFLGRRGRVKDALDLCEPLWKAARDPEVVARLSFGVLFAVSNSKAPNSKDPAQVSRVANWLEQAVAKNPKSTTMLLGLGNLREQQQRYPDAEDLYKRAIASGDRGGVSHNNLAWLLALKDRNGTAALEYINQAIGLKGRMPDFLDTRGIIYLTAGDKQRAIQDLEAAVAGDPAPDKLFHLAQAYLEIHDKEKAKQNLEKAKSKGLVPSKLHPLEVPAYGKVVTELGLK
ncbi:MAG: tetratricopeptide repeat protein [Isosphaeraceae bacterium]